MEQCIQISVSCDFLLHQTMHDGTFFLVNDIIVPHTSIQVLYDAHMGNSQAFEHVLKNSSINDCVSHQPSVVGNWSKILIIRKFLFESQLHRKDNSDDAIIGA